MRYGGIPLAWALAWSTPAQAGIGDNLFGARPVSGTQLVVSAGFPDVELGVRVPIAGTRGAVDLMPRARFTYASGLTPGVLEATLGIDLRWRVFDQGRLTGAVIGSLPVHLAPGPRGAVGVGVGLLWPGFMLTWEIEGAVDVDVGFQFQDDLYVLPGEVAFSGRVPLLLGMGVELATGWQLGVRTEVGPSFGTPGFAPARPTAVGPAFRLVVGVGWTF